MAVYKKVPGCETVNISTLEFDTKPTKGSLNPVTSGGVAEAVVAISEAIPEGASEENKLVDQATLNEATAAWNAGYTPKGPASVSTINGLSGQENGDRYVLTNGGTLSAGSVVVVAGDEVAWDGTAEEWYKVNQYALEQFGTNKIKDLTNTASEADLVSGNYFALDGSAGTKKLDSTTLLTKTAQNALAGNVAPAFDSTRTSGNPYHENDPVVKDGVLYITKIEHYGPWEATHFMAVPSWDANFRSMYKSEFQGSSDDSTIFVVRSNDLEIGWIDSGKNYNHGSRCRTKMFIPIKKGDRIVGVPQGKNIVGAYSFYDATKTFVNSVGNLNNFNAGGSKDVVSEVDGFVRLCFYNSVDTSVLTSTSYFDGCCVILRSAEADYADNAEINKLGRIGFNGDFVFSASMLEQGAYDVRTGNKIGHGSRVRCISPIKVNKGDDLFTTDTTITFMAILLDAEGVVVDHLVNVGRAYKAPSDGYLVFHCITSQTFSKAVFADKIKLARNKEEIVFVSDRDFLTKAWWDVDGVLQSHANRLSNYREILANRGDEVICNDPNLQCYVREQSTSTGEILLTHSYFSSRYIAPGDTPCKNAIIQNDGVRLLITFAPVIGDVDISSQQHCIKIIRRSTDKFKTLTSKRVLPVGSKKGHPITQYPYMGQSGCFVGENLWVSVDGANDTHFINVVDVENDTVIRSITSELGHAGVMDYCEETDTVLSVLNNGASSKIRLIPNASQITTSIALTDCIEIDFDFSPGVLCFGENPQTIYATICRDDSQGGIYVNKVRKIFLEIDGNGYTGVATIVKEYDLVIDFATICDFGRNEIGYTQDSAYDGYLYLAYGTSGHNYLVFEKNDDLSVFVAVGRYAYDYYTADGTKKYLEPELLALKGDRIYCGSRHYNDQLASLVWLQR